MMQGHRETRIDLGEKVGVVGDEVCSFHRSPSTPDYPSAREQSLTPFLLRMKTRAGVGAERSGRDESSLHYMSAIDVHELKTSVTRVDGEKTLATTVMVYSSRQDLVPWTFVDHVLLT